MLPALLVAVSMCPSHVAVADTPGPTVTVTAGFAAPDVVPVAQPTGINVSATATNPAYDQSELTISGPTWSWSCNNITSNLDGQSPSAETPSNVEWYPDNTSASTQLLLTFPDPGYKAAQVKATATWTLAWKDQSQHTGSPPDPIKQSGTSQISATVAKIDITPKDGAFELWYFEGQKPSNYPVSVTLQAKMTPNIDDSFTWTASKGSSLFDVDSGMTGMFTSTATITSKGKSQSTKDCQAKAVSKKHSLISNTYDFTIDYLTALTPRGSPTTSPLTFMGATGWDTLIPYKVNSKFGTATTKDIEYNENWVSAYTYYYTGCTWSQPAEGSGSITPASLRDELTSPLLSTPQPNSPGTSTTTVDGWGGQWRFGSSSKGKGTTVLNKRWMRYIDHGEHQ